jgi:hypothetical protein
MAAPENLIACIAYVRNKLREKNGAAQPAPAPGYCKQCKQYTIEEPLTTAQPAVQEGRDWSLLEATQESLREHMAEIKRLKAAQPAVPLTDEQIRKASLDAGMQEHYMDFHPGFIRFTRAIEKAHGITAAPEKGQP